MKTKFTLLVLVGLFTMFGAQSTAPGLLWQKTISPVNNSTLMYSGGSVQLSDGSYVFTGSSNTFIPQINKVNSSGDLLWQKTLPDLFNNIPFLLGKDSNENLYFITENAGNSNPSFVKLDLNGNVIWTKTITVNNQETFVVDMDILADGSIILSGDFEDDTSLSYFFGKYDTNGNQLWIKTRTYTQYPGSMIFDTVPLADGGFALVGETVYYDEETDVENEYGWIAKYNASRDLVWENTYISEGESIYEKGLINNAGELLIAGVNHESATKTLLTKKSSSGNTIWTNNYFGDNYYDIALTPGTDNGYLLSFSEFNSNNSIIKKITETGVTAWEHNYKDLVGENNRFSTFIKTNDNNLFAMSLKDNNYALYKFGGTLAVQDLNKSTIGVYPNPVKNMLQINSKENISGFEIYSQDGKKVVSGQNENVSKVDFSNLLNGNYILKLKTKLNEESFKIIKSN